jgi:Kef-type K+ transport system membrane component KefB
LSTSFQSLKANLLLSSGVALTGIAVPIGLSYTLQGLLGATPVQAFAAGAALCSTSLGTTFTVLNASGLSASRLGVVLTSAAMMDDVVGLVMVQVISNLGGDNFSWVTIVRPVLVSVAFAVIAPLVCLFFVKPVTLRLNQYREAHSPGGLDTSLKRKGTAFVLHTLLLVGLVTAATYAGTSNLFAAYIAGASISWWDSEVSHVLQPRMRHVAKEKKDVSNAGAPAMPSVEQPPSGQTASSLQAIHGASPSRVDGHNADAQLSQMSDTYHDTCGSAIYEYYYYPAVSKILQPLFFASVGFSIPITQMFRGSIVWRGIVYAVLMAFGKLVCGLWLVRLPKSSGSNKGRLGRVLSRLRLPPHVWGKSECKTQSPQAGAANTTTPPSTLDRRNSPNARKPFSLHPPLILALAMCARGEIGFLISGVAESKGVFSTPGETYQGPSNIFLVVTWAIMLCTIAGPLGVGLSVRRVKKLQERKREQQEGTDRDVLGVWGVD